MTQEDKQLLLKDLCARLPYNVICQVEFKEDGKYNSKDMLLSGIFTDEAYFTTKGGSVYSNEYKPYLFPFSSITKEQKKELNKKFNVQFSGNDIYSIHHHSEGYWDTDLELGLQDWLWFINWCYKNHFDIYGLISMGLAIDATGLNIY